MGGNQPIKGGVPPNFQTNNSASALDIVQDFDIMKAESRHSLAIRVKTNPFRVGARCAEESFEFAYNAAT